MAHQFARLAPRVAASLGGGLDDDKKLDRGLLIRVWRFAAGHHKRIFAYAALLTMATIVGVLPPLILRQIIDRALPSGSYGLLHLLALAAICVAAMETIFSVANRYLSSSIGEGIIFDLRVALFDKLMQMPVAFFTKAQTGAIMSRFSTDVVGAQSVVTTLTAVASEGLLLIATLAVMMTLSWKATALALVIMPGVVVLDRWVGRRVVPLSRARLEANAAMNTDTGEHFNVSGAWVSKLYGDRRRETASFASKASEVATYGVKSAMVMRTYNAGLSLLGAAGTVFVYWIGGVLAIKGAVTIGTLLALGIYAQRLYSPISVIASARVDLLSALVAFERCFEVLDAKVAIDDSPDAKPLEVTEGRVEFDGVWFRYPPEDLHYIPSLERSTADSEVGFSEGRLVAGDSPKDGFASASRTDAEKEWVLEDISFVAEPGCMTAIVGQTGAGKSTLLSLVPRLYDVDRGAIRIDGSDIREVTQESLRRQIGMVTQETYLFHDTLEANLRYAKPDADDAELRKACEIAGILSFIESLPDGFQTVVGERGYRLSGGEKQRVAIARMVLKDPKIVILDEPTAHLDTETEAAVQEALTKALEGRTSIVVSHRMSLVERADAVYTLSDGRLLGAPSLATGSTGGG
jgi:ATP-binding cassette subfamily B protein